MIAASARIGDLLSRPDKALRAGLVYGPDAGLRRECAATLVAGLGFDAADPFASVELTVSLLKNDPARLADETAALTPAGGPRLVCLRDATDTIAPVLESWLADAPGEGFVVVEAAELAKRSALRRLFEAAEDAVAIACYPDEGPGLARFVSATLASAGSRPTSDAVAALADRLGADRAVTRRELEKLILYKGDDPTITLDDVEACIADSATASVDAVVFACASGDFKSLEQAFGRAVGEGYQSVAILRAGARHFQRLLLVTAIVASGRPPETAMAALRPPVFFKHRDAFRAQLRQWPRDQLSAAIARLTEAEILCKTTGMPEEAICHRTLLQLAAAAARKSRPA